MNDYVYFWPKYIAWLAFCIGGGWLVSCMLGSCANEAGQRQHWQDCGAVMHEVCREERDTSDRRECEYEFYKRCIDAEPTS